MLATVSTLLLPASHALNGCLKVSVIISGDLGGGMRALGKVVGGRLSKDSLMLWEFSHVKLTQALGLAKMLDCKMWRSIKEQRSLL